VDVAEILKKSENSLLMVSFTSEWSGASHIQSIFTKQLETEYQPKMELLELDYKSTHNKSLTYFSISTVPTTLVLKDQEVIGFWEGLTSKTKMRQVIEAHLT
jgi:thioredoxin-like negative regulator of GroEL